MVGAHSLLGRYPRTKAGVLVGTIAAVGMIASTIAWRALPDGAYQTAGGAVVSVPDTSSVPAGDVSTSAWAAEYPRVVISSVVITPARPTAVATLEAASPTPEPTDAPALAVAPEREAVLPEPTAAVEQPLPTAVAAAPPPVTPPTATVVVAAPTAVVPPTLAPTQVPTRIPTVAPSPTPRPTATPRPAPTSAPPSQPVSHTRTRAS